MLDRREMETEIDTLRDKIARAAIATKAIDAASANLRRLRQRRLAELERRLAKGA
jgi:hypothetical protein